VPAGPLRGLVGKLLDEPVELTGVVEQPRREVQVAVKQLCAVVNGPKSSRTHFDGAAA
jgi:hypothetical protein